MRIQNRSPFKPRAKAGYKIEDKTEDISTVYIYDEIGYFGIGADAFVKDLSKIKAKELHVRINSPGGDVFDGVAIYNAIKQHKSKTIVHIDGLAASISSVIALAADEVRMASNAFLMIHEPWSIVLGNAENMREEADLLDKIGGMIAKTYTDKTGKEEKEIKKMMAAETWLTEEEAIEGGFIDAVDEIDEDTKAKAALFDLSVFANVPDELKGKSEKQPTARDIEKALRDAGCSQKQAKAILAEGFQDGQRDVDGPETEVVDEVQRDVETEGQRDVEVVEKPEDVQPKTKDKVAELLLKADLLMSNNM